MAKNRSSPLKSLLDSSPVREAARARIAAVAEEAERGAFSPHAYQRALRQIERQRGRELFFSALGGGAGRGVRVGLEAGFTVLEKALTRVAENRGLPC